MIIPASENLNHCNHDDLEDIDEAAQYAEEDEWQNHVEDCNDHDEIQYQNHPNPSSQTQFNDQKLNDEFY